MLEISIESRVMGLQPFDAKLHSRRRTKHRGAYCGYNWTLLLHISTVKNCTHVMQNEVDKLFDALLSQVGAQALLAYQLITLVRHQPVLSKHVIVGTNH